MLLRQGAESAATGVSGAALLWRDLRQTAAAQMRTRLQAALPSRSVPAVCPARAELLPVRQVAEAQRALYRQELAVSAKGEPWFCNLTYDPLI